MGRIFIRLVVFLAVVASQESCEWSGSESVTVTAEEFRFTPKEIQVRPDHPFTLIIRNQGREQHVFQSPLLFEEYAQDVRFASFGKIRQGKGLILEPGKSIEMELTLPSGVYPFRCWLKGHSGMEGVIVVVD